MKAFKEYLLQPSTVYKIIVGIFVLGMVWANLKNQMEDINVRVNKLEALDLDSRLASIETKLDLLLADLKINHK